MMFSDIRKPEESKRVGGDFLTLTVALPYLLLTFTLGDLRTPVRLSQPAVT